MVNFAAGGIATPADAALMMQLGCDGVFVGSGIFKSGDPARRAAAIVQATTYADDPEKVLEVSAGLGRADGRHRDTHHPGGAAPGRAGLVSQEACTMPGIGVLDLQGGVVEHLEHLAALGVPARRVKQAADFDGLAGLIVPGGESTCLIRLLRRVRSRSGDPRAVPCRTQALGHLRRAPSSSHGRS